MPHSNLGWAARRTGQTSSSGLYKGIFTYNEETLAQAFSVLQFLKIHPVFIGVRAPSDWGGGDLIARKKITKCPKASVVYTYSNRSKNKNVPNSPPRELMKIAFKNRIVREITAFD